MQLGDNGEIVVDAWNRSSVPISTPLATHGSCSRAGRIGEGRAFPETHFNHNPIPVDQTTCPSAVFSQRRWAWSA